MEDDTSDGPAGYSPKELKEPGSKKNEVAGRGLGELLTNVTALELSASDNSDNHSLKETGVSRNLSEEAGLQDVAAPGRRAQSIRKENRKGKDFCSSYCVTLT